MGAQNAAIKKAIETAKKNFELLNLRPLADWIQFYGILEKYEKRFLEIAYEARAIQGHISIALELARTEAESEYLPEELDDCETEIERVKEVANIFSHFEKLFAELSDKFEGLEEDLALRDSALQEHKEELEAEMPDEGDDEGWEAVRQNAVATEKELIDLFRDL